MSLLLLLYYYYYYYYNKELYQSSCHKTASTCDSLQAIREREREDNRENWWKDTDDDWYGSGDFANILINLHDLLDTCLHQHISVTRLNKYLWHHTSLILAEHSAELQRHRPSDFKAEIMLMVSHDSRTIKIIKLSQKTMSVFYSYVPLIHIHRDGK